MDFIFANQSLYYLTKQAFKEAVQEFYELCNEGAIIFATMMSDKGYSMYERGELMDNSLREVKGCPSGRLSGSSYIRFTKDIEELKEDFKPFKPLFWGDYELIMSAEK
ncbi:methyltransferase [Campylobacter jejuni]|nr:methyltransferase [Campylobacter jejuni]